MKPWGTLLLVLIAPVARATADLSVVSFSSDKTVAQYAEPITLTARVANLGPDAATNFGVHLNIGVGYPMAPRGSAQTAHRRRATGSGVAALVIREHHQQRDSSVTTVSQRK